LTWWQKLLGFHDNGYSEEANSLMAMGMETRAYYYASWALQMSQLTDRDWGVSNVRENKPPMIVTEWLAPVNP
jgi:hypothetical protein